MPLHRRESEPAMRAVYPDDRLPEPADQGGEDDWTAYPDQVYKAQLRQQALEAERRAAWANGGTPRREKHTALWAFVALICAVILCLLGSAVVSLYQAYAPFRQRVDIVNRNTFAQGVVVDGVHIGGMTREEAEAALAASGTENGQGLRMTIQADGNTWVLTNEELPFQRNLSQVLDVAYAVGRQGSKETIASSVTPFEYRYAHLCHTASAPAYLSTRVTYDPMAVRPLAALIAGYIDREPMDAQVATFDFVSRSFTFTQDQAGARLDQEALYRKIVDALDHGDYTAVITVQSEPLLPQVTRVELMNTFALVSSYTTQTTADASRNNNVNLAARAVNGTVVMPGETFSFNRATGERTLEKGYLPAAAIAGGTTVDEVGGGVCQVSSTLFNAAVMADLTILSRSPHSWPSNYVDKGRDATVNWPNLDFTFRNDKATPVFIVAYYQQRVCTVEIYGATLEAGMTIDLVTRTTSTAEPPLEPLYEYNPALPPGTLQEKRKARTGYVVETYKVYRRGGAEVRRELLCVSNYPMIRQVLEYND